MLATWASTWWISKDAFSARSATALVMVIAAFKVRLVLLHFMELAHAPLLPRVIFEAWVVGVTGAILAIYTGAFTA